MRSSSPSPRRLLAALGLLCALNMAVGGAVFAQDLRPDGSGIIYTDIIVPDATPPGQTIENKAEYFAEGKVTNLSQYLGVLYNFMISIVGLLAAVMMIVGGFQYLTSKGDAGRIGAAKTRMANAFMGLLLALGAYTVLATINPALMMLKPLIVKQVKSEVRYLLWCEDLIAKGVVVAQLGSTECGRIGAYKNGKSELACMYYGDCAAVKGRNFDAVMHTCLQKVGEFNDKGVWEQITPAEFLEAARSKSDANFGWCSACAQINKKSAREMGYKSLEEACVGWGDTINSIYRKKFGDGSQYWSYCAEAGRYIDEGECDNCDSCIQADIDCQAADNNEDTGRGDCSDNSNSCGCEGYDDSPTPWHMGKVNAEGYVSQIRHQDDTMDGVSQHHLGKMCAKNPCLNFVNKVNGRKNFYKGCKYEGEATSAITIDFNIDCRNN